MAWIEIKLDNILESRNISNREFARRIKIRPGTINDLCNNETKHLPLDLAAKICDDLEIEIADLLKFHKTDKKEEE
ncbi:helix-turn-helix domain-containing protein [Paenibacillus sp. FSL H3-0333]|uniref:helix-turn-helix domain-containing protein n=1 Tax=Paenibacillus sp. FSL H3-0333 TaxID=2921373 RepID=UPI0030FB0137